MRIAIYTSDLTRENQHLMPWRMLLEIGAAAGRAGHQAKVLSGRRDMTGDRWAYGACPVEETAKPYSKETMNNLRQTLQQESTDVLFWPVAWRRDRGQDGLRKNPSLPVVWYVPGAWYLPGQVLRAVPDLGLRAALPFAIQSVYPKKYLVRKLRRPGSSLLIVPSQFSRSRLVQAGWPAPDVFFIPPGKTMDRTPRNADEPPGFDAVRNKLCGRPFYLFLGPPTHIRGIRQLLQAFDSLARVRPDVCLVCLFRSDPWTDVAAVRRNVESSPHAERMICVWQSVGRVDLNAFLEACHAVVLPFLLVPAEIPLAVIEAAGHGKPVITTGPGGTADFVRDFGLAVRPADGKALAATMQRLLDDKSLYADKCRAAERFYAAHPTWEDTAQSWLAVGEEAVCRHAEYCGRTDMLNSGWQRQAQSSEPGDGSIEAGKTMAKAFRP